MAVELNAGSGIKTAIAVVAFIAVIFTLHFGLSDANSGMDAKMAESVRRSVIDGAVLCYSVEGAYPESLNYLADNYGISYDKSKYIVHYQYVAANIRPDVVIIEKKAAEK